MRVKWAYDVLGFIRARVAPGSARKLEALEALQRFFDPLLVPARIAADPGPFLYNELLPLADGLEIDRRDDLVAGQHGLREVAEAALRFREIGLEAVLVAEEELQAFPLVHQRVEGRQDVNPIAFQSCFRLQRLGARPVRDRRAFELDRDELLPSYLRLDQAAQGGLPARVEVARRIEVHYRLRAQGPF